MLGKGLVNAMYVVVTPAEEGGYLINNSCLNDIETSVRLISNCSAFVISIQPDV